MEILYSVLFPKVGLSELEITALQRKRVLITGASFGIGAALAEMLAKMSCSLVLVARAEEKLVEIQKECLALGSPQCDYFCCNLYDLEDVDDLCTQLNAKYEYLDFFVSNAGKSIMRSFKESKDRWQDIQRTFSINFQSPVKIIQNCYGLLSKCGSRIVSVSAVNLFLPETPYWAAYHSSKKAFDVWCKTNAAEWAEDKVLLRTVYFPLVNTRMTQANEQYKSTPKMEPEQAAVRIIKLMCGRKRVQRPWWSYSFFLLGFFKNLWAKNILKKYQSHDKV